MGYGLKVKDLVIFGDSLSCNGNACMHADNPFENCWNYPKGYFSDGEVWVEVLAEKLRIARPLPSLIGGFNFAYGGAETGWKQSFHILNVGNQIKEFIERVDNQADPDNLYILWAGGNDIKNFISSKKLISNLEKHIIDLVGAGAKRFVVPNIPPLERTPAVTQMIESFGSLFEGLGDVSDEFNEGELISSLISEGVTRKIKRVNAKLASMLLRLEASLGITIYHFDAFSYFNGVMGDLRTYGLGSVEEVFIDDGFHPAGFIHRLIAEKVVELVNE